MLRAAIFVCLLAASVIVAPEVMAACLSASEARTAVAHGNALPLSRIKQIIRSRNLGELISAKLCDRGGLVYQVTVLSANGGVKKLTVSARTGSIGGY